MQMTPGLNQLFCLSIPSFKGVEGVEGEGKGVHVYTCISMVRVCVYTVTS